MGLQYRFLKLPRRESVFHNQYPFLLGFQFRSALLSSHRRKAKGAMSNQVCYIEDNGDLTGWHDDCTAHILHFPDVPSQTLYKYLCLPNNLINDETYSAVEGGCDDHQHVLFCFSHLIPCGRKLKHFLQSYQRHRVLTKG